MNINGMQRERIDLKISSEFLEALFKGKRLTYQEQIGKNKLRVITLYPPNHGIYIAHEDYMRLKGMAMANPMHGSDHDFIEKLERTY